MVRLTSLLVSTLLPVLLAAGCIFPRSGWCGPDGKSVPRAAILFLPGESFPWPNAVPPLFERALDSRGVRFEPVSLPRGSAENLAGLAAHAARGELDDGEKRFLRSESRSRHFDAILLLQNIEWNGASVFKLRAAVEPFDSIREFTGRGNRPDDPFSTLPALVDSLAAAFGWESGSKEAFRYGDLFSEDRSARALATGRPTLLQKALMSDSSHQELRLHLAARLALSEYPHHGRAMLDSIDPASLPPLERETLPAWRAAARGDERALESAVATLIDRFPGRFETSLLAGLLGIRTGGFDEAEAPLRRAVAMRPFDPLPHRLIGDTALEEGFLELAAREYAAADDLGEGGPLARIGIASVLYSEGRIDEAWTVLNESPLSFPHRWTAWFYLVAARANLALAGGRFSEGESILLRGRDEANRLGNEEALTDLTVRLCRLYMEGGVLDAAAGEVGELRFRSESPFLAIRHPGLVPYLEGLLGVLREDFGTISAKKLEIETTPGSPEEWIPLLEGEYLLEASSGWEAVPPLRRAEALGPTLRGGLLLGRAYLKADQPENARRTLEEVVERGESLLLSPPSLPLVFYYLGRSLEELGDLPLARIAYREFLNYWARGDRTRPEWRHAQEVAGHNRLY